MRIVLEPGEGDDVVKVSTTFDLTETAGPYIRSAMGVQSLVGAIDRFEFTVKKGHAFNLNEIAESLAEQFSGLHGKKVAFEVKV